MRKKNETMKLRTLVGGKATIKVEYLTGYGKESDYSLHW